MFKMKTRTAVVHIPYRGAAPAIADVIGGQVDMSFATLGSVLPQINAGQVRALAVAAPKRSRLLPNVPTFEESGLKDFRLDSWYGLMAPAGTPRDIIERLNSEIQKAVASPAYKERLETAGLEAVTDSGPSRFAEQIHSEIIEFGKVVTANNLVID
jgi:tripartite-type tricarboxylate transporter receptor subunit TctC